jgi:hypothetical protein
MRLLFPKKKINSSKVRNRTSFRFEATATDIYILLRFNFFRRPDATDRKTSTHRPAVLHPTEKHRCPATGGIIVVVDDPPRVRHQAAGPPPVAPCGPRQLRRKTTTMRPAAATGGVKDGRPLRCPSGVGVRIISQSQSQLGAPEPSRCPAG